MKKEKSEGKYTKKNRKRTERKYDKKWREKV